jgi:hypothetical protein
VEAAQEEGSGLDEPAAVVVVARCCCLPVVCLLLLAVWNHLTLKFGSGLLKQQQQQQANNNNITAARIVELQSPQSGLSHETTASITC